MRIENYDEVCVKMFGPAGLCSFCGERPAAAMWSGAAAIFVCQECAVTALPSLVADTVKVSKHQAAKEVWARAEKRFWRTVFRGSEGN